MGHCEGGILSVCLIGLTEEFAWSKRLFEGIARLRRFLIADVALSRRLPYLGGCLDQGACLVKGLHDQAACLIMIRELV